MGGGERRCGGKFVVVGKAGIWKRSVLDSRSKRSFGNVRD